MTSTDSPHDKTLSPALVTLSLRDLWLAELWKPVPEYRPTAEDRETAEERRTALATMFGDEPADRAPHRTRWSGAA